MRLIVLVMGFYTLRPIHVLPVEGMQLAHDNFDNNSLIVLVGNYDALKNKLALSHFLDICIHFRLLKNYAFFSAPLRWASAILVSSRAI